MAEAVAVNAASKMRLPFFLSHLALSNVQEILAERQSQGIFQVPIEQLWRSHFVPLINSQLVQQGLDAGMKQLSDDWKNGDAPWELGKDSDQYYPRPSPNDLEYYQPQNRCYNMVLFSWALAKAVFPRLQWNILVNERHSVAIAALPGFFSDVDLVVSNSPDRSKIIACMDLLFSNRGYTAEHSVDFADPGIGNTDYFTKWTY